MNLLWNHAIVLSKTRRKLVEIIYTFIYPKRDKCYLLRLFFLFILRKDPKYYVF